MDDDLDITEYDDHGDTSELSRIEWALDAEQRIEALTGEQAPDLINRLEVTSGAAWRERFGDGADHGLGTYDITTHTITMRDCPEAERQRADIHEGLHAWSTEHAGHVLEPLPLNEGLTQHLTRVADPSAGREIGYEVTRDEELIIRVPDLAEPESLGGVRIVEAPEVYPDAVATVERLEQIVGRDALLELYQTADHTAIRESFDAQRRPGAWDRLCDAATRERWDVARAIIDGGRRD